MTHFHFSSTWQTGISNLLYRFMNALLSLSVCCSLIIFHVCAALEKQAHICFQHRWRCITATLICQKSHSSRERTVTISAAETISESCFPVIAQLPLPKYSPQPVEASVNKMKSEDGQKSPHQKDCLGIS